MSWWNPFSGGDDTEEPRVTYEWKLTETTRYIKKTDQFCFSSGETEEITHYYQQGFEPPRYGGKYYESLNEEEGYLEEPRKINSECVCWKKELDKETIEVTETHGCKEREQFLTAFLKGIERYDEVRPIEVHWE